MTHSHPLPFLPSKGAAASGLPRAPLQQHRAGGISRVCLSTTPGLRAGGLLINGRVEPSLLSALLTYEEHTGKLFWRPRTADLFAETEGRSAANTCATWNSKMAGAEALTAWSQGYRSGKIFNRSYRAHRVIWALVTGNWPADEIDHINRDRGDNRLINLRAASRSENARNTAPSIRNVSGIKGVSRRNQRWEARIQADGGEVYLGRFGTRDEAASAYAKASADMHGRFRGTK